MTDEQAERIMARLENEVAITDRQAEFHRKEQAYQRRRECKAASLALSYAQRIIREELQHDQHR